MVAWFSGEENFDRKITHSAATMHNMTSIITLRMEKPWNCWIFYVLKDTNCRIVSPQPYGI
jgi:hypothetical protein